MSNKVDKTKRLPAYFMLLVGMVVCAVIAFTAYKNISVQEETKTMSYIRKAGANALVYYKDNEFYNDKVYYTKEDGLPFLGSIVDKIAINYNYEIHYSDDVTGNYTANITKTLVVNAPASNEQLYSTEPEVIDETTESYGAKDFNLQKSAEVDYQYYLNKYKAWAKTSKVSSDAKLIVKFEVVNNGACNSLKEIKTSDYYTVSIPLTETTFKISESTNVLNEEVVKTNKNDKSKDEKFVCYIIISLCLVLMIILLAFMVLMYRNDLQKESLYARTLKKLITTYDNILVSVQKLPDTKGLNIVNVTAFDDLVDAQSEVRLPINYMEDTKKKLTKFILIRNDMAWVYTLKEGDLEDEKKA